MNDDLELELLNRALAEEAREDDRRRMPARVLSKEKTIYPAFGKSAGPTGPVLYPREGTREVGPPIDVGKMLEALMWNKPGGDEELARLLQHAMASGGGGGGGKR